MTFINQDVARSVVASIGSNSRAAIIDRARTMRTEIAQIFADAERWNRVNVPWKGGPIDPDPDGKLKRLAEGLDKMLAAEDKRLNL
jgi:hypothetical protein